MGRPIFILIQVTPRPLLLHSCISNYRYYEIAVTVIANYYYYYYTNWRRFCAWAGGFCWHSDKLLYSFNVPVVFNHRDSSGLNSS